jgi:hypothetical protein
MLSTKLYKGTQQRHASFYFAMLLRKSDYKFDFG